MRGGGARLSGSPSSPRDDPDERTPPRPTPPSASPGQAGHAAVVFDLRPPATTPLPPRQILQIAARRFVDGQPQPPWMTYVRPTSGEVPGHHPIDRHPHRAGPGRPGCGRRTARLPRLRRRPAAGGPQRRGLRRAADPATADAPAQRCRTRSSTRHAGREGCRPSGTRVGTLAQHFGCHLEGAHQADVDVEMLCGVVAGLVGLLHGLPTGRAVWQLLHRAGDPWAELVGPPSGACPRAGPLRGGEGDRQLPDKTWRHCCSNENASSICRRPGAAEVRAPPSTGPRRWAARASGACACTLAGHAAATLEGGVQWRSSRPAPAPARAWAT